MIPMGVTYTDTLVVGDMYYMVVDINWHDYAGIDENPNELAVAISPNPSNGIFKINLTDVIENEFEISVQDLSGKTIYNDFINGKEATLNLTEQISGIYFVKIISNNRSVTKRVQIQH